MYLLSRKQIDELVVEWEKAYMKTATKKSLPTFIAHKQAEYLLGILLDKGFDKERAKQELQKLLGNQVVTEIDNNAPRTNMAIGRKGITRAGGTSG